MVSSNLANDQMMRFILIKKFFNDMGGNRETGESEPPGNKPCQNGQVRQTDGFYRTSCDS